MGYGGKYVERARARELRPQAWTLQEIATELGVAKGIGVGVGERRRLHPEAEEPWPPAGPNPPDAPEEGSRDRARVGDEADAWLGEMSDRDLTMYCLGLYAGEGARREGSSVYGQHEPRRAAGAS